MNIRSIDLQVLLSQTTEVGKTQHATNQQNASQQQSFAAEWQRLSQDRQHQVQIVNQSEGGKVRERKESPDKRRNQGDSNEQQHSHEAGDSHSSQESIAHTPLHSDPIRGHKLDIKT